MSKDANKNLCPVCAEGELRSVLRTEHLEYSANGGTLTVEVKNVPVQQCPHCEEVFSGPEAGRMRDDVLRHALGLLSPQEIRSMRERMGLTQAELAKLTGIGEASISRWERGQLIQSKAFDRYLRLLAASRENLKRLRDMESQDISLASA